MNDLLSKFGKRIASLRKERKLSQEKLAELADLHRTYIGAIERGERNPSVSSLVRIANGMNVHVRDLVSPLTGGKNAEREQAFLEIISLLESRDADELKWIKMVMADAIRWNDEKPS